MGITKLLQSGRELPHSTICRIHTHWQIAGRFSIASVLCRFAFPGFPVLMLTLLLTACRSSESRFTPVHPSTLAGSSPGLNPVQLTNRLDPTWLKPPTDLFT